MKRWTVHVERRRSTLESMEVVVVARDQEEAAEKAVEKAKKAPLKEWEQEDEGVEGYDTADVTEDPED